MIRSTTLLLLAFAAPSVVIADSCCPCGPSQDQCLIPFNLKRHTLQIDGNRGASCIDPKGSCDFTPKDIQRCCNPNITPDPNDFFQTDDATPSGRDPQALVNQECPAGNCNNSVCHICWRSEGFPTKKFTQIAALHVPVLPGTTSSNCEQLFHLGLAGGIPDRVCRPFQDFVELRDSCGCPAENSAGNGNSNGNSNGNGNGNAQQEDQGNGNEDIRTTLEELLAENGGESLKAEFMEDFSLERKTGNRVRRNLKGSVVKA